jgi:hypothetical protein
MRARERAEVLAVRSPWAGTVNHDRYAFCPRRLAPPPQPPVSLCRCHPSLPCPLPGPQSGSESTGRSSGPPAGPQRRCRSRGLACPRWAEVERRCRLRGCACPCARCAASLSARSFMPWPACARTCRNQTVGPSALRGLNGVRPSGTTKWY